MTNRFQSSSAVLAAIRERLASAGRAKPEEILEAIVTLLVEGRGYAWAGIYLAVENRGVWQAQSGRSKVFQNAALALDQLNAEIAAPIRLGARTLGLIVLQTHSRAKAAREWGPKDSDSSDSRVKATRETGSVRQERVLAQQAAKLVARYLTSDRAKQLLRKVRAKARETEVQPHKSPQSARAVVRRAAAGERVRG